MKIKTKLSLVMGLLLLLIAVLSFIGSRQVNALSNATEIILEDNYNTLHYARNILVTLDQVPFETSSLTEIEVNLIKQESNITEQGEKEITAKLRSDVEELKRGPASLDIKTNIRKDLNDLMLVNMQAIERKSDLAKTRAVASTGWIAFTGTICFLIALSLFFSLPASIANPIKELTESTKQIAAMNYGERVNFENDSEFGELATAFNVMAKKLEAYNNSNLAQLLVEKKRVESLLDNMHEPVIGLDEKGIILFVNQEALKILGLNIDELIGFSAEQVAAKSAEMKNVLKDLTGHPSHHSPIKIFSENQERYYEMERVDISIVPTGEQEAKQMGYFIVLKNITPFKELDSAKTNFIATISHELKTPISAIKLSLQLLENKTIGQINDEQKQLLESIKEDSNRLLKITGELLNLAQVETGKIQLSMQSCDPQTIINYALDAVKTSAEQKKVSLKVKSEVNVGAIKADAEKTAWVLVNLLTNAIRYSKEGGQVEIEVQKQASQLRFSVIDHGEGIEEKYLDKLFHRYFQVPGKSQSGTGLGLSISKEFIEGQGGQIKAESAVGVGSQFSFTLNL